MLGSLGDCNTGSWEEPTSSEALDVFKTHVRVWCLLCFLLTGKQCMYAFCF